MPPWLHDLHTVLRLSDFVLMLTDLSDRWGLMGSLVTVICCRMRKPARRLPVSAILGLRGFPGDINMVCQEAAEACALLISLQL
jgi:hypothetical protein